MIHELLDHVLASLQNQFVGGGLILMFTGSLIAFARNVPLRIWFWMKRRVTRAVAIHSEDPLFDYVTYWLNSQERFRNSRVLKATSQLRLQQKSVDGPDEICSDDSPTRHRLRVFYSPSVGRHFFRYQGVWISIGKNEAPQSTAGNHTLSGTVTLAAPSETYLIEAYGRGDGRVRVLRGLVDEIVDFGTEETEGVRVYSSSWGHWSSNGYVRMRRLDTVVLPAGVGVSVLEDMKEFRSQQSWYRDVGIPWHKGYLFHGLPGTGKTSLAAACAGELGMDIYLLNLSGTGMNDESLSRLMSGVRSGCMVVLEDIDCTVPDRDAAATNGSRVTLSGLLNCLDGITSREGCVIVMTTNRRDGLDSALTRPGRVDFELEFGYSTEDQIRTLRDRLNPRADILPLLGEPLTMAEVQQRLLETRRTLTAASAQ